MAEPVQLELITGEQVLLTFAPAPVIALIYPAPSHPLLEFVDSPAINLTFVPPSPVNLAFPPASQISLAIDLSAPGIPGPPGPPGPQGQRGSLLLGVYGAEGNLPAPTNDGLFVGDFAFDLEGNLYQIEA
jgi:hypothetical protein